MNNPPQGLRWLYVDFNSYFASVEQQLQPHLRGKPVAVVPVESDSTCAIAASYEAKAYGIRTGTPIYEAKKLCPDLRCVLARHENYVEFHHRIIAEINQHIPITAVCSIDEMACRLMENEAPLAAAQRIARNIKQGLSTHVGAYVRCSIGIAPNRYLAKVATNLQKPDGLTILHARDVGQRLAVLTSRDLPGIGRAMERRLHRAGVHDWPGLWALSQAQMHAIWGSVEGARFWQLLRGEDLLEIETSRRTVGHSHVLAPAARHQAEAINVIRRLTQKAASRLRRMDYYASALDFGARLENGMRIHESEKLFRAQDNMSFLQALDRLWARSIGKMPGARVKKLSVVLHGLVPAADVQPDLLAALPRKSGPTPLQSESLSRAMDRLNHRYGRDTVLLGMLPAEGRRYSGSKVAFTRIPQREEFFE